MVALEAGGTWVRLGDDVTAVCAFACAFALVACLVDRDVRAWVDGLGLRGLAALALAALAWLPASRPLVLLLALPLATVLAVALARRAVRPRVSSAPAASPGARRGAT